MSKRPNNHPSVCVKNAVPEWSGFTTWGFGFAEIASARFMGPFQLIAIEVLMFLSKVHGLYCNCQNVEMSKRQNNHPFVSILWL